MAAFSRLAAFVLLTAVVAACSQVGTTPGERDKIAQPIAGTDAEGRFMQLSDYRGKVVLLDFWFSSCGPCRAFEPHERLLLSRYEGRPFVVLGVNTDPKREMLIETQRSAQLPWRSWYDGRGGPIASQWSIGAFPTVYLIDHLGRIGFHSEGMPPPELKKLERKLEQLVQEAEEYAAAEGN
jgi:thiol-disulfide isomerase/thioredoxin